jgi:pimeloyl-ACP methyl ester carboxylesterase
LELNVPTAVVAGTSDRMTPIAHARRLAGMLPDSLGLTELPGIGHMTPVEAPEAVTAGIRDLVKKYAGADEQQVQVLEVAEGLEGSSA